MVINHGLLENVLLCMMFIGKFAGVETPAFRSSDSFLVPVCFLLDMKSLFTQYFIFL